MKFLVNVRFLFHFSGATHSKVVICNEEGAILSTVTGPGTNHWVIGIPGVAARISEMINRAKTEANIPHKTKLLTLGLSLSGCEQVQLALLIIAILF